MAELAVAEANLRAEEYAADARADLRQVEAELAVLGYDLAAHQHLRAQVLPGLQGFVVRKAEADRAEAGLQAERTAAGSLQAQVDLLQEKRAEEGRALDELRAVLTAAEAGLADAPAAERGLLAAQKAMQDWQIRFGVANQRVQACRSLVGSAARTSSELQVLQRRGALLEELRTACGRNGVPAMIIESALPELEASANELLGRMTNGRMNVRFDTQRMSQKGDAIETLEIRIADEVGERAYELFSGGEAFRINFAVRIALSRMLARRAGAALRTLFIDEGFGTQDAQGRERLVEAIKAIETDFDRIFVITHIDELRDAFPARIEVTKSTRGSGARVV
jgi:exonuclease SbcC